MLACELPADKRADPLDCLLSLSEFSGPGLPDVPHPIPYFERNLDSHGAGLLGEAGRVAEQHFVIAHLNQQWRQAMQLGVDRRCQRGLGVGGSQIIAGRELQPFARNQWIDLGTTIDR